MRILIVEDDPKVARTLVKGLEADHYAADVVTNGEEALELVAHVDYDGLVMDWNLPGVNGLAVLQRLRKSGSRARVLFLSAHQEVADRVAALRCGADDYMTKPFSFEELRARMDTLLRRPQEPRQKLVVDDLELDQLRRAVTRAGKPITLTPREYGVLEYLMRNAGRTVTRNMIVEHVWNLGFKGLTNIVEVYINYLRIKIDQPFSRPLIHTDRGIGYKLCVQDDEPARPRPVDNVCRMPR
jgi:DNA-binding response OmpR family regulator